MQSREPCPGVAQICNLPPACRSLGAGRYRRIAFCSAPECFEAEPISNRRDSAAAGRNQIWWRLAVPASYITLRQRIRPSIHELGPPLCELAGDCEPPPRKSPRDATISTDTDRVQLCATPKAGALDTCPLRASDSFGRYASAIHRFSVARSFLKAEIICSPLPTGYS